jgi:hypothetical protein
MRRSSQGGEASPEKASQAATRRDVEALHLEIRPLRDEVRLAPE